MPESLRGESGGRPRGTAEVHTAACRSTRRHCAGRGSRVIVHSDGTLSLDRRRQEREEAKLLVQTVTLEASSRSGSPCVTEGIKLSGVHAPCREAVLGGLHVGGEGAVESCSGAGGVEQNMIGGETYPTSKIFSCYTPTHGAYSRLDRFLLANDGSLDIRQVVYQVRSLSDHAPLLLECETCIPKPAIPLWRQCPDLLGDPEYKQDLQGVLNGYFSANWGTATTRGIEWEALKIVIRGESLSKTYGIRKRLDRELTQQEDVLTALERQVHNGDASESDCLEVRGRIVDLWDRLDNYVHRNYRQRLFREGDRSGVCWLGFSGGSVPFPSSRCSAVLLEKRF
ncbi:hypothetical protein NDU88_003242 [Pleurodeles waltl]|uniref:Uncharacterized protein n=1 Tax=Pleurodeles waltl TaxID=8319 RepID=A0AAV7UZH1_PLEWA|nr:hypothetical protein NDU88_003242 [Pleurodeles waltl]